MYSFHTQSDKGFSSKDISFKPQVDAEGNYVGTYASPDFERGHDPASTDNVGADKTFYNRGYTWLTHVDKGNVNSGIFTIDFAIQDFRKHAKDADGVHLQFTALNDWIPSAVDLTKGYPPQTMLNQIVTGLDYMFIHREGKDLDTLYTSLIAPYKYESYIKDAKSLETNIKDGVEATDDVVKAVKIVLKDGRTDYVVYATNNQVTYTVIADDKTFDFRGFVGVYRVDASGRCMYAYINDGDILADAFMPENTMKAYEGTVVDFTKDFVAENSITVKFNQMPTDLEKLIGSYVYVDATSIRNTAYRILGAEVSNENVILHLGNTTVIEGLADKYDVTKGYVYAIKEGQKIRIPISNIK